MPKQINTGEQARSLVQRFGLKGSFRPTLDEVIVPVTSVDQSPNVLPSYWGRQFSVGASGAGNVNELLFFNPANSPVTCTIEQLWFFAAAGTTDAVGIIDIRADGRAGAFQGVSLDFRTAPNPSVGAISLATPAVGFGPFGPIWRFGDVATVPAVWKTFVTVPPGHLALFDQVNQNVALQGSIVWSELPYEV